MRRRRGEGERVRDGEEPESARVCKAREHATCNVSVVTASRVRFTPLIRDAVSRATLRLLYATVRAHQRR